MRFGLQYYSIILNYCFQQCITSVELTLLFVASTNIFSSDLLIGRTTFTSPVLTCKYAVSHKCRNDAETSRFTYAAPEPFKPQSDERSRCASHISRPYVESAAERDGDLYARRIEKLSVAVDPLLLPRRAEAYYKQRGA